MTFTEIEKILGSKLPNSARESESWWGNENPETSRHPNSQAWQRAGMRATVNMTDERVIFTKSM
jgi:hypothetical protein